MSSRPTWPPPGLVPGGRVLVVEVVVVVVVSEAVVVGVAVVVGTVVAGAVLVVLVDVEDVVVEGLGRLGNSGWSQQLVGSAPGPDSGAPSNVIAISPSCV